MNLTKAGLAPSPACFEIVLCIFFFSCKAEVKLLWLFSIPQADNCKYLIDSCNSLWFISGNLPLEINDSVSISASFFKKKKKGWPQGPTLMVIGKFENVTQIPPYYQARKWGSKYNKSKLSFNLVSCKPISYYLELEHDLWMLGHGQ